MSGRIPELVAVLITVIGCVYASIGPFFHETIAVGAGAPENAQIVQLTGVSASGVWTEDDVHSGNYWYSTFRPGRPVLRVGKPALFRLKSSDVVHTFYCPGLGIGPVEVYPGHVEEILVTAPRAGHFGYYCTTLCGEPHFGMQGVITVEGDVELPPPPSVAGSGSFWLTPPPPEGAGRVERGKWLFQRMGCVACHGQEGKGGVRNWNYVKDTVPALNTLAERLMLYEPEDVEEVVGAIERGVDLDKLLDDPPVPRFNVVLAQYKSVFDVISRGNPAGKKDPQGPTPPLRMPSWGQRLSEDDIRSVIAYLLTLQPWEEEEDAEEDDEPEGGREVDERAEEEP